MFSIAVMLASCSPPDSNATRPDEPVPALDQSTPQATLKSYWDRLDWFNRRYPIERPKPGDAHQQLVALVGPLITQDYLDGFNKMPPRGAQFVGTIGQVAFEGTDVANVDGTVESLAKRSAALTPTPVELFEAETFGGRFQYRMVRGDAGWKIAELKRVGTDSKLVRIR